METSKAVEFRAISKIIISASSASSSGGVHREDPFGPLRCRSRARSNGFGLVLQPLCECGTSPRILGLQSHQSEFNHIQICSVTMTRFNLKGRMQQKPTPCGTNPVLTTCPQVPASQRRGGLWSWGESWAAARSNAACVSSGRREISRDFLGLGI